MSSRVTLTSGTRYLQQNVVFTIIEVHPNNQFTVESSFGARSIKTLDELVTALFSGELLFETLGKKAIFPPGIPIATDLTAKSFDVVPEQYREEAWRRYNIIRDLLRLDPSQRVNRKIIEDHVSTLNKSAETNQNHSNGQRRRGKIGTALSRSSVERWINAFITCQYDPCSLAPYYHDSKNKGQKHIQKEIEDIIQAELENCERHPAYRSVDLVQTNIKAKII